MEAWVEVTKVLVEAAEVQSKVRNKTKDRQAKDIISSHMVIRDNSQAFFRQYRQVEGTFWAIPRVCGICVVVGNT